MQQTFRLQRMCGVGLFQCRRIKGERAGANPELRTALYFVDHSGSLRLFGVCVRNRSLGAQVAVVFRDVFQLPKGFCGPNGVQHHGCFANAVQPAGPGFFRFARGQVVEGQVGLPAQDVAVGQLLHHFPIHIVGGRFSVHFQAYAGEQFFLGEQASDGRTRGQQGDAGNDQRSACHGVHLSAAN